MSKIVGMTVIKSRLAQHMLHRGVDLLSARPDFALSCMHTKEEIDKTVAALADSLKAMMEEGSLDQVKLG